MCVSILSGHSLDMRKVPFEAEYPNMACSPNVPTPKPAMEAVTITRDGSSCVEFFCSSGANLADDVSAGSLQAHCHYSANFFDVQSYGIENTLNVQIHDFRKRGIRVSIELLAPCSTRIREQYIDMIRCLLDFLDQRLDTTNLRAVGWD